MDRHCPEDYTEISAECSVEDTKALIAHIRSFPLTPGSREPLVQPIITPRFAITCSDPLLASLGRLALSEPSIRIQTHISENKSEVAFVKELFPDKDSYAGVYDAFGLLRSNTILAHAIYLEAKDLDHISRRQAGISHCPTSNFNLTSGVASIGQYLDLGLKVLIIPPSETISFLSRLGWVQTFLEGSPPPSCRMSRQRVSRRKLSPCSLNDHFSITVPSSVIDRCQLPLYCIWQHWEAHKSATLKAR